jgi:hypothetical protein
MRVGSGGLQENVCLDMADVVRDEPLLATGID